MTVEEQAALLTRHFQKDRKGFVNGDGCNLDYPMRASVTSWGEPLKQAIIIHTQEAHQTHESKTYRLERAMLELEGFDAYCAGILEAPPAPTIEQSGHPLFGSW